MVRYLAVAGIVLSVYALYVEHKKSEDPGYEALCDVGSFVSCSKVFTSEYGRMLSYLGVIPKGHALDVPNAALGLLFYTIILTYTFTFSPKNKAAAFVMLGATLCACASSVWLGYVLSFVLHDLCMVCVSTYVVNLFLLIALLRRVFFAPAADRGTKQKAK